MLSNAIPVDFHAAFPDGALLRKVAPLEDFDKVKAKAADTQARTPDGVPMWAVTVIDLDDNARSAEVKVKVASAVQPSLPGAAGQKLAPVELDGLTVTPWVNDKGRLAYSFRATGLRAPAGAAKATGKAA